MPNLLIRNLDESALDALKRRAKKNGHTQQEEASQIINDAVVDRRVGWPDAIREQVEKYGGFDIELPVRSQPRYPNGIFNEPGFTSWWQDASARGPYDCRDC